ncbi:MAG: amidohydrolase [Pseudomonadales bacterium]|nr:amidohydrolase [Pseudomonadales bacterium]
MGNNTRMRLSISILLITSSVLAACAKQPEQDPADLVLLKGGIYTVDSQRSWAQAAAIDDGVIVAVGTNEEIGAYIGNDTEVIDLEGRMAMPGIHDSHVHPLEGGYEQVYCNLWALQSVDEIVGALQACEGSQKGAWFNAVGLDLGVFGLIGPDKSILDGIAEDKYIFVDAEDGHAALVNDKVLELIGINAESLEPEDGIIERREGSREPNGTLRESSRDLADKQRPKRDHATSVWAMQGAVKLMNSHGITSAYDVWVGEHEMQVYKALDDAGELSLRVLGGIIDEGVFEKHTGEDFQRVLRDRVNYESDNISYNSIKIMVDGVFEGETGATLEPYHSVDHAGPQFMTPDQLNARVMHYYNKGMLIHFHAIGDRAVREALDAIEYARENGDEAYENFRHTISHLGLVHPNDRPRFAELNTGASVTMVWAYNDKWTQNLEIPSLGLERVSNMYPIRSIQAAGGVILGGSDWNYGELDPLRAIETAITRDDPQGPTQDSEYDILGNEHVDLATMIDAYTINGAWQIHAEDVAGSIEAGKRADIAIYDRNLFEIDAYEISEARVDFTIFDGRIVYRRQGLQGQ